MNIEAAEGTIIKVAAVVDGMNIKVEEKSIPAGMTVLVEKNVLLGMTDTLAVEEEALHHVADKNKDNHFLYVHKLNF